MAYAVLRIQEAAQGVKDLVDAAKQAGTYAGHERRFDAQMVAAVEPMVQQAETWFQNNAQLAQNHHVECKRRYDSAIAMLKLKVFTDREANAVVGFEVAISQRLVLLKADNSDLTSALAPQFRLNGWVTTARDGMTDASPIAAMVNVRVKQIKDGTGIIQLTRRIEEYEKRMLILRKEAKIRLAEGANVHKILKAADKAAIAIEAAKAQVDIIAGTCHTTFGNIQTEKKRKVAFDAMQTKMFKGYMPKIEAAGKQVRGNIKTMRLQLETVMKYQKALPGVKDAIKTELARAATALKQAEDVYKKFAEDEKSAAKIMAVIMNLQLADQTEKAANPTTASIASAMQMLMALCARAGRFKRFKDAPA
jgi:hypothetical protein